MAVDKNHPIISIGHCMSFLIGSQKQQNNRDVLVGAKNLQYGWAVAVNMVALAHLTPAEH